MRAASSKLERRVYTPTCKPFGLPHGAELKFAVTLKPRATWLLLTKCVVKRNVFENLYLKYIANFSLRVDFM